MGSLAHIAPLRRPLIKELHQLEAEDMHLSMKETGILLAHLRAQSSLVEHLKVVQGKDLKLNTLIEEVRNGQHPNFSLDSEGVLHYSSHLCVPEYEGLREAILEEAHSSKYSVHSGSMKMYQDLKPMFWWEGMKKDIEDFVSRCLVC